MNYNEHFNIPDGFKFVKNTYVKYNCRLAPHMQEYLGENKWICYQILEEIIYDACKSSIIEPYVEITNEEEIVIEPEKIHNWSPGLTMAYIDLDKNLKFHGIFAADALEDIIKKILKKNYDENIDGNMIKYAKGLSGLDAEETKEMMRNPIYLYFEYDQNADNMFKKWFGKDSDQRKQLMEVV